MIRKVKLIVIIIVLVLAGIGVYAIYKQFHGSEPIVKTVETDHNLPVVFDSIRAIGQWSLATVDVEQEVDTLDNGVFGTGLGKDKVRMVFHGTLHYGIDMTKTDADWISGGGDTAYVSLPSVVLLDDKFLDERRTRVVEGSQDFANKPEVKAGMARKAKALMIDKGNGSIPSTQKKAEEELRKILLRHGYKFVVFRK